MFSFQLDILSTLSPSYGSGLGSFTRFAVGAIGLGGLQFPAIQDYLPQLGRQITKVAERLAKQIANYKRTEPTIVDTPFLVILSPTRTTFISTPSSTTFFNPNSAHESVYLLLVAFVAVVVIACSVGFGAITLVRRGERFMGAQDHNRYRVNLKGDAKNDDVDGRRGSDVALDAKSLPDSPPPLPIWQLPLDFYVTKPFTGTDVNSGEDIHNGGSTSLPSPPSSDPHTADDEDVSDAAILLNAVHSLLLMTLVIRVLDLPTNHANPWFDQCVKDIAKCSRQISDKELHVRNQLIRRAKVQATASSLSSPLTEAFDGALSTPLPWTITAEQDEADMPTGDTPSPSLASEFLGILPAATVLISLVWFVGIAIGDEVLGSNAEIRDSPAHWSEARGFRWIPHEEVAVINLTEDGTDDIILELNQDDQDDRNEDGDAIEEPEDARLSSISPPSPTLSIHPTPPPATTDSPCIETFTAAGNPPITPAGRNTELTSSRTLINTRPGRSELFSDPTPICDNTTANATERQAPGDIFTLDEEKAALGHPDMGAEENEKPFDEEKEKIEAEDDPTLQEDELKLYLIASADLHGVLLQESILDSVTRTLGTQEHSVSYSNPRFWELNTSHPPGNNGAFFEPSASLPPILETPSYDTNVEMGFNKFTSSPNDLHDVVCNDSDLSDAGVDLNRALTLLDFVSPVASMLRRLKGKYNPEIVEEEAAETTARPMRTDPAVENTRTLCGDAEIEVPGYSKTWQAYHSLDLSDVPPYDFNQHISSEPEEYDEDPPPTFGEYPPIQGANDTYEVVGNAQRQEPSNSSCMSLSEMRTTRELSSEKMRKAGLPSSSSSPPPLPNREPRRIVRWLDLDVSAINSKAG